MAIRRTFTALALACLGPACSVDIPEGKFRCTVDGDCPSDWACVEKLCYRDRKDGGGAPDGSGGDGAADGAADGSPDGGSGQDAGFDAGIITEGCDAPTTYYRDQDDDGLGDTSETIAACSVSQGYVTTPGDCDDACSACTTSDAAELCDGFDNDCDGVRDEGALAFSQQVDLEALPSPLGGELVGTDDGFVMLAVVSSGGSTPTVSLKAQRISAEGVPVGSAETIARALPVTDLIAADHLDGKIVVAWYESDGLKATVLNARDLSVSVEETAIPLDDAEVPFLDVVVSKSASGGRVLFAYPAGREVHARTYFLDTLIVEGTDQTLYVPSDPANSLPTVTLAAAPCVSGFYAAIADEGQKTLRVVPMGANGTRSGPVYQAPTDGSKLFTARPALHVEGGDCDNAPTRLMLAYATDEGLTPSESTTVHVTSLSITRAMAMDTLGDASSFSFEQPGWVPPGMTINFGGSFPSRRAMGLAPFDGRYLLSLVTSDAAGERGLLQVLELRDGAVVGTQDANDVKPAAPLDHHLLVQGDRAWLGAFSWSNKRAAALFRVGCGG